MLEQYISHALNAVAKLYHSLFMGKIFPYITSIGSCAGEWVEISNKWFSWIHTLSSLLFSIYFSWPIYSWLHTSMSSVISFTNPSLMTLSNPLLTMLASLLLIILYQQSPSDELFMITHCFHHNWHINLCRLLLLLLLFIQFN